MSFGLSNFNNEGFPDRRAERHQLDCSGRNLKRKNREINKRVNHVNSTVNNFLFPVQSPKNCIDSQYLQYPNMNQLWTKGYGISMNTLNSGNYIPHCYSYGNQASNMYTYHPLSCFQCYRQNEVSPYALYNKIPTSNTTSQSCFYSNNSYIDRNFIVPCSSHLEKNVLSASKLEASTQSLSSCHSFTLQEQKQITAIENVEEFIKNCANPSEYINTLKGSRKIQKMLEKEEDGATKIFYKVKSCLDKLLTNVYGNYVCKKLFCLLKQAERLIVWKFLAEDLKKYAKHQHANYSIQMLITQSDSDSERVMIEKILIPHFPDLALNEHGIKVLVALASVLNFVKTDSLILDYLTQNFYHLAINNNSIILCTVMVAKYSAINSKLLKCNLLGALKPYFHFLLLSKTSILLLIHMLEDWGLITCQCLAETILNNFIYYSAHSIASIAVIKLMEVLEFFDKEALNQLAKSSAVHESIIVLCESSTGVDVLLKLLSFTDHEYISLLLSQLREDTRLLSKNYSNVIVQIEELLERL